jgi:hypothetical protein
MTDDDDGGDLYQHAQYRLDYQDKERSGGVVGSSETRKE